MKTLKVLLYSLQWFSLALVLSTCSEPEIPRPEITSINPDQGVVGDEVVIAGKNLSTTEVVFFGNAENTPASRSDIEIRTAVPAGLTPGNISVTVKTEGGNSNSFAFTVLPSQPEITSIEPDRGSIGMEITLKGKHFASATSVAFGTKTITGFISKTDTELKLLVPEGLDPGAQNVNVTTDGGTSENSTFTVVGRPTISSFSPASGPAGRKVTIEGTHFEDASKVLFGTEDALFAVKNSASIEATVPEAATTGKIKVVTPGGEAISTNDFVLKDAPEITDFSPASGIAGTLITINGKGFDVDGLVVRIGTGNATTVTVVSPAQLTVKVPATATTGKITVETSAGTAISAENFTLVGPPVITSFTPVRGGIGTEVVIIGQNFENITTLKFNTTAVLPTNVVFVSGTEIKALVPAGATSGKISIITPAGTGSSVTNFTVLPAPTITSFTPGIGPAGRIVTITGTHFEETSKVFFGTTETVFVIKSSTTVEATVPVNASTGKVKVITPGGEAISATDFVVKGSPEITDFAPVSGIVGTLVTINGKNFDAGTVEVKFGTGKASQVTIVSATQLTAIVPLAAITGKITVETAAGSVLSAGSFILIGAPTVNSFSPASGAAGVEVTIAGTNFVNVNEVKFNNTTVLAANYTIISTTQMKAKVPAGATSGKISVSTPAGMGSSATNFIVLPPPTITSFSPSIGPVGRVVSITGTNFGGTTKVFFGTTEAVFEVKSATSIDATVPVGAVTGKLKVITPGGEATSAADFTVKAAPTITSFSPVSGIVGAIITINGSNFDAGGVVVKFGTGTATEVTVVNATQLTAKVPATATTGKITVETAAGSVLSAGSFTLIGAPAVNSFSPASGATGVEVTIAGTNFVNVNDVKFNNTTVLAANYTIVSATQMKAKVPAGAASGKISVSTPAGTGSSATNFIVFPPPTITSFSPSIGPVGRVVSITGTNFSGATKVFFGTTEAVFEVKSATSIDATVPVGAVTGKLKVTTPGGEATSAADFTVKAAPTITSFSPVSGIVGAITTINGSNFDAGGVVVKFGTGTATEVTVVNATQLTAKVPATATTGKITVETAAGSVLSATNFTLIGIPTVTTFTPASGGAGLEVTINGTNFIAVSSVKFNNTTVTAGNYTVVSATQIKANVPAGATTGKISVTTAAGTGTSATDFIVLPLPTITSFSPSIGPVGRVVSITGTNFDGATKVFFGTTEAVFEVKSATSIDATVPVGAVTGKLKVITPGGEATSATDFTVKAAPTITSFSPVSGIVGAIITINGSNFDAGGVVVKFGTGTATEVTAVNATQLTAKVPATATTGKITVETAAGSVLSATNFTLIGIPTVTTFTPASGGAGLEVTINGTNFIAVSSVKFNNTTVTAGNYTVVSATQIKANVPAGATTGKISVTTAAGTGTSATDFILLFPPMITSFNPVNGSPGSNVVISGSGFVDVSSVKFNEVEAGAANITVNSPNQITVKVPAGATSGKIKVTNALSTATSTNTFYVTPFISTITPTSTAAGSTITISGTNLEGSTVNFGSTPATPLTNNGATITVTVPTSVLGAMNVTVTNNGGTSNIKTFTATPPVVLDEIVATKNIVGQLLLLKGSNLLGATKVLFGNVEANILTNTSKVVTTLVPALPLGNHTVKLVTTKGTSNGKIFEVLNTQTTSGAEATLVNAGGASVVTLPPGYVPPVANLWTNTAAPGDSGEKFLILDPLGAVFTVRFSIDGFDVDEGSGIYDHNIVDGVMNNYIEFTVNGVRYVGFWTPRTTGVDEFGDTVCFANMTLISTQSGKQLKIVVSDFSNCP